MAGIDDLHQLLAGMEPELCEGEFVFCTYPNGKIADLARLDPLGMFREAEGLTLILRRAIARQEGFADAAPMRMITLTVHSSLEAVGLTAAFSAKLRVKASPPMSWRHSITTTFLCRRPMPKERSRRSRPCRGKAHRLLADNCFPYAALSAARIFSAFAASTSGFSIAPVCGRSVTPSNRGMIWTCR